ncbi:MAG: RNA methyltransferase substrate-binding domain-containing protein [Candidatus Berkiella sp.]
MASSKIIFGFHAVLASLSNHPQNVLNLYCQDKDNDPRFKALMAQAKEQGIKVQMIARSRLDKLTQSTHHQGVAAEVRAKKALDE